MSRCNYHFSTGEGQNDGNRVFVALHQQGFLPILLQEWVLPFCGMFQFPVSPKLKKDQNALEVYKDITDRLIQGIHLVDISSA